MPVPLPSSTMRLPATSSRELEELDEPLAAAFHTVQAVPNGSAPPPVGGACSSSSGGESGPTGTVLCAMKRCSKGMSAVSSHILHCARRPTITRARARGCDPHEWRLCTLSCAAVQRAAGLARLASAAAGIQSPTQIHHSAARTSYTYSYARAER